MAIASPTRGRNGHQTISQVLFPHRTLVRNALLLVLGSLFIAGAARVSITTPFTPVPITMQPFAVLLVGGTFGAWLGMATAALYVAEGVIGLPFFAGGTSGMAIILGSSGGYLVGYPFVAALVGWLTEKGWDRTPLRMASAMMLGNVVLYAFGLSFLFVWGVNNAALLKVDHMSLGLTLKLGLLPFIPGDLAKLVLAAGLVPSVWQLLHKLGVRGATEAAAQAAPVGMRMAPLAAVAGFALAVSALMPWHGTAMGLEQGAGWAVLLAGLVGSVAAYLRMRETISAALLQVIGWIAGGTGGVIAFVHLVAFSKTGTLELAGNIAFGVPVAVVSAIVLLGATASEASADPVE